MTPLCKRLQICVVSNGLCLRKQVISPTKVAKLGIRRTRIHALDKKSLVLGGNPASLDEDCIMNGSRGTASCLELAQDVCDVALDR